MREPVRQNAGECGILPQRRTVVRAQEGEYPVFFGIRSNGPRRRIESGLLRTDFAQIRS